MTNMGSRLLKIIRMYIILALIAAAYYIFYTWSGYGIPCLFRTITGFSCPGCGISRMFAALFKGNIKEAFEFNQFVFAMLPAAILYAIRYTYYYVRDGRCRDGRIMTCIEWGVATAFIIFGVIRNIVL